MDTSVYKEAIPWSDFNKIFSISHNKYTLTYIVDGEIYKIVSIEEGSTIIVEPSPTKDGYTFSGWRNIPSTMPAHDITVTGSFTSNSQLDGHEYVNLGLPSGNCWATTNYGADTPEGYGYYLNWGENNIISSNWGTAWTTPSLEDIRELENNCTWTWGSMNGRNGYIVTGKNGNSIFLPASGVMMMGQSSAMKVGEWVYYWTSKQSGEMAYIIMSTMSNVWYGEMETSFSKLPIRPVTKDVHSKKCSKPSIIYNKGDLSFTSETEGVEFVSTISDTDIASYNTSTIKLGVTYQISVYATKSGYENSETATATLCWIDVDPKTEGINNSVANIRALPLLIQTSGNQVNVQGLDEGTNISVYNMAGQLVGSAKSAVGITSINTTLRSGDVGIVKIGDKAIKVVMK